MLRNVELPLIYARVCEGRAPRRALEAIDAVGLGDRARHIPSGAVRRPAAARRDRARDRHRPGDRARGRADRQPRHRLDPDVLRIFRNLNTAGRTIVMITHESDVAAHAKRVIQVADGRIVRDIRHAPVEGPPPDPDSIVPVDFELVSA